MKLEGRTILLYVDGGWTISGLVEKFDDTKVIISVESKEDLYVIFRDKISIVKLIDDRDEDKKPFAPEIKEQEREQTFQFPSNNMTYDENNFSLPRDMINKEMLGEIEDDDFSVFFGNGQDEKISFRSKNDKKN
jgi:hypothetical protein